MSMRAIALGLSLALFAAPAFAEPNSEVKAAPKTEKKAEPKKAQPKKAEKKAEPKVEPTSEPKAEPAKPPAYDPKPVDFGKLPKPIQALHVCATAANKVDYGVVRYTKSVLFVVSCPAARGKLTPFAVYVAADAQGKGAKRISFEFLAPDGSTSSLNELFSVAPAREAYTATGDPTPNTHSRGETPWITGAWGPEDRPGVCAVSAIWRLSADKAELMLWEEAKDCPKNALPKYETKVDKKPPPLVEP